MALRALVLVAGGGTVGHLGPGFAVAEVLRGQGVDVRFVTPGETREDAWFPPGSPTRLASPAPRWPRLGRQWPLFPLRLGAATLRALALLRRERPRAVLGLGGWPCVPVALASRLGGIPLGLIASDEKAGVAVRLLAPLADRIYVARRPVAEALARPGRVLLTGPALRSDVLRGARDPARFGLRPDRRTLLVTGGSLGAEALNRALAEGLRRAVLDDPSLTARIQVIHSTGERSSPVAEAYRTVGLAHHVTPFLRDMGTAYRTADLVVGRAGALTCAELTAVGTPAVLVPYPHHADRQQYANARGLVEEGAALLLEERDLTPGTVRREVIALLLDRERLTGMRRAPAPAGGALQIGADLIRLLKKRSGRTSTRAGMR